MSTYGGYSPATADTFPIVTFGSHHGAFANVTGWELSRGKVFRVNYGANDVTLTVPGGPTTRVSVASDGSQANRYSFWPSISADGRFIAFYSAANNLDGLGRAGGVFVHDRQTAQTTRISVGSDGAPAQCSPGRTAISADGRYVAFQGLLGNDKQDRIYVHDRHARQTTRVSVWSPDKPSWMRMRECAISGDGRHVAFLVEEEGRMWYLHRHDRQTGETRLLSVALDGKPVTTGSTAALSADGRYAAYVAGDSEVSGDTNRLADIIVRDTQTGRTSLASVASDGTQGNFSSGYPPAISADGRYVAFLSEARNLVPDDKNDVWDVFVHDRQTGETTRISATSGGPSALHGTPGCSISADGRYVAFGSESFYVMPGDGRRQWDVFMHDRRTRQTSRVSLNVNGVLGNGNSHLPAISAQGRYVAFVSRASNLVSGDSNGEEDIFVHDCSGDFPPEMRATHQPDGTLRLEWWDQSVLHRSDRIGEPGTPLPEAHSPWIVTPDAEQMYFWLVNPMGQDPPGP